jgi:hypothetical protein
MDYRELVTRLRLIDSTLSGVKIEATDTNLDRLLGSKQELKNLASQLEREAEQQKQEAADGNRG